MDSVNLTDKEQDILEKNGQEFEKILLTATLGSISEASTAPSSPAKSTKGDNIICEKLAELLHKADKEYLQAFEYASKIRAEFQEKIAAIQQEVSKHINERKGPDLKTRAIRYAAENETPGCELVNCRYDLQTQNFFASITLDKEAYEVDLGQGGSCTWDAHFLARGIRPYKAFYNNLARLERLNEMEMAAPVCPFYDTETCSGSVIQDTSKSC